MALKNTPKQQLGLCALGDLFLVAKAKNGDNAAFSALFERYRSAISNFISLRTPNLADVEDLTMEAFGKAFTKIGAYVPNYAFSTWLYSIALNNCIDYSRKQKLVRRCHSELDIDTLSSLPSPTLNPEEALIRKEQGAIISSLVQELNPPYRNIIELRFFEEKSYDEISIQANIPIGTVKVQLFRAKVMVRQMMDSYRAMA